MSKSPDANDFVVAPAGIKRDLANNVRRQIEGEIGDVGVGVVGLSLGQLSCTLLS